MSNYCKACRYDPDKKTGPDACPYNYLYWNFIDRHAERFAPNPRMRRIVSGWIDRAKDAKTAVRKSAAAFLSSLEAPRTL